MSPTLKSTGGGSLWAKISRCSPWSRPLMFGSAESEHPRQTNGEIISEEFQFMWSQYTNDADKQRDRQTTCDRKTALWTKVHHAVKIATFLTRWSSVTWKVVIWKVFGLRKFLLDFALNIRGPEITGTSFLWESKTFWLFSRLTPGGQTAQPILTQNGSDDVHSRKNVLFAVKIATFHTP